MMLLWLAVSLPLIVAVLLLRRRFLVVSVDGSSMVPTLRDGQRVLVRRRPGVPASVGDVVVLRRPLAPTRKPWLIKRVVAVAGDPARPDWLPPADDNAGGKANEDAGSEPVGRVPPGMLVILGDNRDASWDSRQAGFVPADSVLGVVVRALR